MNKKIFSSHRADNKLREDVRNALAKKELLKNKKISLYIVDDDQVFSRYLESTINKDFKNVNIQVFRSGKEAIDLFYNSPPDLVILDINMPELNGHKVAKIMNCIHEIGIPILFVSANNRSKDDLKYLEIKSSFDFLSKPVDKNQLKKKVKNLIPKVA
ncbi:MAG: DNA-binding response OmpR family regulator [Thermoproteota archaeon]